MHECTITDRSNPPFVQLLRRGCCDGGVQRVISRMSATLSLDNYTHSDHTINMFDNVKLLFERTKSGRCRTEQYELRAWRQQERAIWHCVKWYVDLTGKLVPSSFVF